MPALKSGTIMKVDVKDRNAIGCKKENEGLDDDEDDDDDDGVYAMQ